MRGMKLGVALVCIGVAGAFSVAAQQFLATISLQCSEGGCANEDCSQEKIFARKSRTADVIAACLGVAPDAPEVGTSQLVFDWPTGDLQVVRNCDGEALGTVAILERGDCATATKASATTLSTQAVCIWFYSLLGGDVNGSVFGKETDSENLDTGDLQFTAKYTLQATINGLPCTGKITIRNQFIPTGDCP